MTGASANGTRPSPLWPALVALAAVVVYLNTLGNGFALDDVGVVRDNPHLRSLGSLPRLFFLPYWPDAQGHAAGLYRPVTLASFAVNRVLTGSGPAGFHAVNVALHAIVSVLAWFAFRRAGVYYGTALLGALLFAVHPVHVEAVANVVGRSELLAAAGVLSAWLCHRRASDSVQGRSRTAWALAAPLFYLIAILSKESAVLAPLLFVADDLRRTKESGGNRAARAGRSLVFFGVALIVALALRAVALGGLRGAEDALPLDNPLVAEGAFTRVATALWVQARYAALMVWPGALSSDYSFDAIPTVQRLSDPRLLAGIAFAVVTALLAAHGWRRSRPLFLGATLWIVFFTPTANLLFTTGALMAERLAYLPSLGFCLLAGHLGAWVASIEGPHRKHGQVAVVALSAVALLSLGARARHRNPFWKDNATLALHDVETTPRSAKLQAGAAIALAERGDRTAAEQHFKEAIAIYPDYAQARYNLGILLAERGARSEAIDQLLESAALTENPRPLKAAAGLLEQSGRTDEALDAYARAAALDPTDLPHRFNWGRSLLAAGRTPEAERVLSDLATEAPAEIPGRISRAMLAEIHGNPTEATTLYRKLLSDPALPAGLRSPIESRLSALTRED
jgi:tetratricopeptide (TPR) repeat protein